MGDWWFNVNGQIADSAHFQLMPNIVPFYRLGVSESKQMRDAVLYPDVINMSIGYVVRIVGE